MIATAPTHTQTLKHSKTQTHEEEKKLFRSTLIDIMHVLLWIHLRIKAFSLKHGKNHYKTYFHLMFWDGVSLQTRIKCIWKSYGQLNEINVQNRGSWKGVLQCSLNSYADSCKLQPQMLVSAYAHECGNFIFSFQNTPKL